MVDWKHMAIHAGVGAAVGWVNAAAMDYAAFQTWKSFADVKAYDWKVAAFRWIKGIVIGAVGNGGAGIFV